MPIGIFRRNDFARNVLTLMTGTIIAQAIPIAIIPVLTRIFAPEDFGLLALYTALLSIFGVVSAGRYEVAIMLTKAEEDAKILLQVSVVIAAGFSLCLAIPVVLWNENIAAFLGNPDIASWLYLIPLSVLLTGVYNALTYWNNRAKKFKHTAISKVNQSLFQGLTQAGFGFMQVNGGLILGQITGILSSVFYLLRKDSLFKVIFKKKSKDRIKQQIVEYKDFPKYSTFGAICDTGAVQMPVLILTKSYSAVSTGMFSLTFRVLNMPSILISSAISQVLFQRVVEISNNKPECLNKYIIKIFLFLFLAYLPALPVLILWGDSIFAFVFGEQWRQAGNYAGYLVIAVAARFAVSPLSSVLALKHNIKKGFLWQVLYLVTITSTLLYFSKFTLDVFITAFVVHEVVLYCLYLLIILRGSKAIN